MKVESLGGGLSEALLKRPRYYAWSECHAGTGQSERLQRKLRRPSGFDRSATLLGRVPQARRATVHYVRRTEAKLVYANITGKATP
jgi:hypothetical protein